MENETFKTQFISRFYQLLNGAFKYENLKPIYDNAISQIVEEIQRQAYRFDNPKNGNGLDGIRKHHRPLFGTEKLLFRQHPFQ